VVEAIFGLVGVVIGALVTGGVEFLAERRRDAGQQRKAARLLDTEFRDERGTIRLALDTGHWWPEWDRPSVPNWPEHARPLAGSLDTRDWSDVVLAAGLVRLVGESRPAEHGPVEKHKDGLIKTAQALARAGVVLRRHAGDEQQPTTSDDRAS
jgi:hypothetical protein